MRFFNTIKRRLLCLIERIKLSEHDYERMKIRAEKYDNMMSTIKYDTELKWINAEDRYGNIILRYPYEKTIACNVDIKQMLEYGGIYIDTDIVKINVTGL